MMRSNASHDHGGPSRAHISRTAPDSVQVESSAIRTMLDGCPGPLKRDPITAWPMGDCWGANRNSPPESCRITNLTRALHRLQPPSNKIPGAGQADAMGPPLLRNAKDSYDDSVAA